jgi:hypothetical protein
MFLDSGLFFTNTATAGGDTPTTGTQTSTNIIDLGVGTSASNPGIPASAAGAGGRDLGIADKPSIKVLVEVITAFTGGTSLQVNLQGAPDAGSYTPGTWTTYASGPVVAEASLTGPGTNYAQGARILEIDLPRPAPGVAPPRYLRLLYVSVGTHSAGAIVGTLVLDRFDQLVGTTGLLSGYQAGINVAN